MFYFQAVDLEFILFVISFVSQAEKGLYCLSVTDVTRLILQGFVPGNFFSVIWFVAVQYNPPITWANINFPGKIKIYIYIKE